MAQLGVKRLHALKTVAETGTCHVKNSKAWLLNNGYITFNPEFTNGRRPITKFWILTQKGKNELQG